MRDNLYTDCYFAFIDILGFKEMIKTKSCQQILHIHESYTQLLHDIVYRDQAGNIQTISELKLVKHKVMSDSICFYIESNEYNALYCLLSSCAILQRTLLELDEPVLVRGSITKGNVFTDGNNILFGPALVEAYLGEGKAEFPRIIIEKDILEFGKNFLMPKEYLLPYFEEMVFSDSDGLYSVDFVNYKEWPMSKKQKTINFAESVLNTTTDKRMQAKYLYLLKRLRQEDKENTDA